MNHLLKALLADHMSWNLPLLLLFITLSCFYFLLLHKQNRKWLAIFNRESYMFHLSLILLYLAIGSPLLAISYLSISLHMLHMSILFFVIPPLFLLGIPSIIYRQRFINKISILFIRPMIALTAFSVLFFLYHIPINISYLSSQPILQKVYLFLLFVLALRMWWPIINNQSNEQKTYDSYVRKSMLFITPACLLLIIGALLDGANNPFLTQLTTHLCLPADSSLLHVLPVPFNTKIDQLLAGASMMGIHKTSLIITARFGIKNE
ncbi:cytochrome c oxidase assembly protein [Virgibacillus sp. W0430]|uniref:cytochrome c oxidase assembly protein n=1 Tax=Virgibacillus sp. W0430 TaxID=3391580 RepID=UPI003F449174